MKKEKIIFETDMDLSDAKCREIGRIIAHWSLLEFLMGIAVGNLKGLDRKKGRALTLKWRVDKYLKEIPKAAKAAGFSDEQITRMDDLLSRIKDQHERRNDVAHGVWGVHRKRWALIRYVPPDHVDFGNPYFMKAKDLKRIANKCLTSAPMGQI